MHYVLQRCMLHDLSRGVSVTLHWFILTRFWHHISHCVLMSSLKWLSMITFFYYSKYDQAVMYIAHAQNWISVTVLGAHVVLLARTWADWTGENLRGWKKSDCAYMMRLFKGNGEWTRIEPLARLRPHGNWRDWRNRTQRTNQSRLHRPILFRVEFNKY